MPRINFENEYGSGYIEHIHRDEFFRNDTYDIIIEEVYDNYTEEDVEKYVEDNIYIYMMQNGI